MALHSVFLRSTTPRAWLVIILLLLATETSGQILTLTPSLSLGERYDDNIFQSSSNQEHDFVTIITPAVRLRYVPKVNTVLDLDYRADFEFFADHSELNQNAHRGTFRLAGPLTRILSISARDLLSITEEPGQRVLEIDELTGLRPISEQSRVRTTRNRAEVSPEFRLLPRIALRLFFDSLLEDVNVPEEVDEFQYTLGAEVGYLTHIARDSRVFVSYSRTSHAFSKNDPQAPDVQDFQIHTVSTGFRHTLSPTLSGDVAIGYTTVTSDEPGGNDDTSVIATFGLTKVLRTGQAVFRYRRLFTSGRGEGGSVLADIFTVSISALITPKITATLNGNLSFFDFQTATGDDRLFWAIQPGLVYQVLRFWTLSVAYDYRLTNFYTATNSDRRDHRLIFTSQFQLREQLFLEFAYRYTARRFDEVIVGQGGEFERNEVLLTLTFAPTFIFQ